jgi:hypothetical protein
MNSLQFKRATKAQSKLRLCLVGPPGSGKTYTALSIARYLGSNIAVIDTERGSASKYSDEFVFDALDLDSFSPTTYIEAIVAAERAGYDVLIIDSLSHAWAGKDGALELVEKESSKESAKGKSNKFTAWKNVTPAWNRFLDTILQSRLHIIGTMRSKIEYVLEQDSRTGKTVPRKVGTSSIFREGGDYEFDIVGDMTLDHTLIINKTRCKHIDGGVFHKPGEELSIILKSWLNDGQSQSHVPHLVSIVATESNFDDQEALESQAEPALDNEIITLSQILKYNMTAVKDRLTRMKKDEKEQAIKTLKAEHQKKEGSKLVNK